MQSKAKTLIERFGFLDPDRQSSTHDEIQVWALENIEKVLSSCSYEVNGEYIPFTSDHWRFSIQLERPIKSSSLSQSIIGFIDLYVILISKAKFLSNRGDGQHEYLDNARIEFAVEIKSAITSIGELVRQINFYRSFISSSWLVVSPDSRYEHILKNQQIYFSKYQSYKPKTSGNGQLYLNV